MELRSPLELRKTWRYRGSEIHHIGLMSRPVVGSESRCDLSPSPRADYPRRRYTVEYLGRHEARVCLEVDFARRDRAATTRWRSRGDKELAPTAVCCRLHHRRRPRCRSRNSTAASSGVRVGDDSRAHWRRRLKSRPDLEEAPQFTALLFSSGNVNGAAAWRAVEAAALQTAPLPERRPGTRPAGKTSWLG